MTACVNRKHTKKVAAVVTASLVGALSLGAAPVAAVADTGIETLAAEWHTGAKVTAAEDGKGSVFTGDLTKPVSFDLGSGKYLVPTEVTNQNGDKTDVIDNELSVEYTMPLTGAAASDGTWDGLVSGGRYKIDGKGAVVTLSNPVSADFAASYFGGTLTDENGKEVRPVAGAYTVTVGGKVSMSFKLVASDPYAGAYIYEENSSDPNDTSDKAFVYNGTDQASKVKVADANGDPVSVALTIRNSDGVDVTNTAAGATGVKNPGTYTVEFTANGKTYNVKFTLEKLNLSETSISVPDILRSDLSYGAGSTVADRNKEIVSEMTLGGKKIAGMGALFNTDGTANLLKITNVTGPNGGTYFDGAGEYTFTVAEASNNGYIDGTAAVTFSILDSRIFDDPDMGLYYGSNIASTENINLTEGESFDASKIKVRKADGSSVYAGDQLEVTYTDQSTGKAVDVSALAEAGKYTVNVRVKPFQDANGAWIGGSETFDVVVKGNMAYSTNVSFYLDGELANTAESVDYDGTDQLERVTAKVANPEGGSFEYGTDFGFKVEKDGKEVDSIVDAGEYEITIDPITFELDGNTGYTFTLTVDPLSVDNLKVFGYNGTTLGYNTATGDYVDGYINDAVAWTGSAVEVPGVQYWDADAEEYVALDSSLYNVVSIRELKADGTAGKVVKEAIDEGAYTVRIALSDEAGSNYALKSRDFSFQVVKYNPFDDVESPAWYASVVADAKYTNVVNGISGTNLYAPEADITRADAICILFNLAGGDNAMGDYQFSETTGWITGFDDVDGHAYYAKALAWAHSTGVANGYAGTTSFRPEAKITREEFASLLANFAKVSGKDVAADGALEGVSDANTVSDWAEANVAWAVENGIMGNGGFVAGQSNISRAEVAAMAMNYRAM